MPSEIGWLLVGDYPARQKLKNVKINRLEMHTCWNKIVYIFYGDDQNECSVIFM